MLTLFIVYTLVLDSFKYQIAQRIVGIIGEFFGLPAGKYGGSSCFCIQKTPAHKEQAFLFGDPCGNRTHVNGVRGRCLNRLTNGPYKREAGIYLFSQAVSSQLSSAQVSLTSVFGMGTGGTSPSSTPAIQMTLSSASLLRMYPQN